MSNKIKLVKYSETARAVSFRCPGCGDMHVAPIEGSGATWQWNGDLEKPTLSPSLLVRTGHHVPSQHGKSECWCSYNVAHPDAKAPFECYVCHSFVRDGQIQFLGDCTHKLAGQTVDLAEISA